MPRPLELVRRALLTAVFLGSIAVGCRCQPTEQPAVVEKQGDLSVLVIDGKKVTLPAGESPTKLFRDDTGKRFAYERADGFRFVYVIGDKAYAGPTASGGTVDFGTAPTLEKALGTIFELSKSRSELVQAVKTSLGDAALASMLADGAHVDDKIWDETFATLPAPQQDAVKKALATYLEAKKPAVGLRRAVLFVPLREPARKTALAARVRELSDPIQEPRANAVLLRALASVDKDEAVKAACAVLAKKPLDAKDDDQEGRALLAEAAYLALVNGDGACPKDVPVDAALTDACQPYFRCGPNGPLDGRETSNQMEPLCTKTDLAKTITAEMERAPADVMKASSGTRAGLFAFAALLAKDALPAAFKDAHERRRFVITQPKEPECDGAESGKACHCDEVLIRDQACRHTDAKVKTGICQFDVDAAQKKIGGVVALMGH